MPITTYASHCPGEVAACQAAETGPTCTYCDAPLAVQRGEPPPRYCAHCQNIHETIQEIEATPHTYKTLFKILDRHFCQ